VSKDSYEALKAQVDQALADGKFSRWPSDAQRVDWAFGNTKIENQDVTREMIERAVMVMPNIER